MTMVPNEQPLRSNICYSSTCQANERICFASYLMASYGQKNQFCCCLYAQRAPSGCTRTPATPRQPGSERGHAQDPRLAVRASPANFGVCDGDPLAAL